MQRSHNNHLDLTLDLLFLQSYNSFINMNFSVIVGFLVIGKIIGFLMASDIDWKCSDAAEVAWDRYHETEPLKSLWSIEPKSTLLPEDQPIRPEALRIVVISDTHAHSLTEMNLPPGDILIHCGDLTRHGTEEEIRELNSQLGCLAHLYRKMIVVSGNHDTCLGKAEPADRKKYGESLFTNAIYLIDESVTLFGIKFYGAPWIPPIEGEHVFVLNRGEEMDQYWSKVPIDVDVLISHAPPLGVLDRRKSGIHEGSMALLNHSFNRIKPKFHLFGHMHGSHGVVDSGKTVFINAAICYYDNEVRYRPVVFDLSLPDGHVKQ